VCVCVCVCVCVYVCVFFLYGVYRAKQLADERSLVVVGIKT